MSEKSNLYFTYSGLTYNVTLLFISVIIWGLSTTWYPSLDGVSVYELWPSVPSKDLFVNTASKPNEEKAFVAEASLIDYCIFPKVYNELISIDSATINHISTYLKNSRGLTQNAADIAQGLWNRKDFKGLEKSNTEYNLPYDNLVAPNGQAGISSKHYPPLCRCLNKVFDVYGGKGNIDAEFRNAQAAIDNCLSTRHIIKRQALIGSTDFKNSDMANRKYVSRYALLFQLCLAFAISFFYNMIDFKKPINQIFSSNGVCYVGLVVVFVLLWLSHVFSAKSTNSNNAISFSTILTLPAVLLGLAVEYMWSCVAKHVDIGRQTLIHPLCFYFILSALFTISLIENGVFTLSVIITHIFQCNAMSMAYAGALFVSHGKLWKNSTSSRTGMILLIFLPATMHIFHMVPIYPVNCELNFLWVLPAVFAGICYSKVLFIDHFMDDESNTNENNKFKVTHSDHLLSVGQVFVVAVVVFYYIIQLSSLRYGESDSSMMAASGGRLTNRLNFEFGEMNIIGSGDKPFYSSTLNVANVSDVFYVNT
jgi:hypothetical protein